MINNVLNLQESQDGNRIKQGDQSVMRYTLQDANNDDLGLDGKKADIYLFTSHNVAYKSETTVKNNVVEIVINDILPVGTYTLEIWVANKYCFPSDRKTKIEITESVIGKVAMQFDNKDMWAELIKYGIANGLIKNNEDVSEFIISEEAPKDTTKIWIDTTTGGNE